MENILLLLAACTCCCCAILSFVPAQSVRIKKMIQILWCMTAALVVSATMLMVTFQVLSRFEYKYVYNHTDRSTAIIYKISSLWSGQEGSFLLWALILSIMGSFVMRMKGNGPNRAFGIYAAISFCILTMCFVSQPFAKMDIVPTDGLGLNEALKDPWMVVHPPLVFVAYSAMAILFSLSATLSKDVIKDVANPILLWLRISWFFLGLGILSGSIWAYRALGWGGYWAWDPIENLSLVPWLVLCGYLHRKEYNNRAVCIVPFSIACIGVFLARSGLLKDQSVHAYADGNAIITWILMSFILGVILFLAYTKIRKKSIKKFDIFKSLNDYRLIIYSLNGYATLIFMGTVAPVILKVQTPIAYYTAISVAFAFAYSTLLLAWDLEWLKRRNILMICISTILVIGIIALSGSIKLWWLLSIWICLMPLSLWLTSGFRTKSLHYYLSHLGMVLLIVGTISSSALGKETFLVADPASNNVIVQGIQVPISMLAEKDVLIATMPLTDLVIQCSKIVPLPQDKALIPYETKPLIMLFWIGCFAVIILPFMIILSNWVTKKMRTKRQVNHDTQVQIGK